MSGLLSFNGELLKHTQPAKNNSGVILYIQTDVFMLKLIIISSRASAIMALIVLKVSYKRYRLLNELINPGVLKQ